MTTGNQCKETTGINDDVATNSVAGGISGIIDNIIMTSTLVTPGSKKPVGKKIGTKVVASPKMGGGKKDGEVMSKPSIERREESILCSTPVSSHAKISKLLVSYYTIRFIKKMSPSNWC